MSNLAYCPAPESVETVTEDKVLRLLTSHTYEEVRAITGWSRGKIYQLALRHGARKTESRIMERQQDRRKRQMETLTQLMNTTAKADVLDFFDAIPDDSISLHLCSPPYNLGKSYGDGASADTLRFTFFHGWLMQIVSEISRTLKPGGVACINVGKTRDWQGILMPLDVLLHEDLRRSGLTFQSRVVWTMNHGLTPKHRLSDRYETILIFSKGEQATFNPNAARTPQKQPDKKAFKGPNKGQLSGNPYGAFPSDVWNDIPQVANNHPDASHGRHPAQFPLKLAKRAILLYTMAGDLACDCFSGSGTSWVASKETGRDFVGADLFYEDLRAKRLAATTPDAFTPLPGVTEESVAVWQAEAKKVSFEHESKISEKEDQRLCKQAGLF